MTANAINAKREALELRRLSSEELDAVSGGFYSMCSGFKDFAQQKWMGQKDPPGDLGGGQGGGQNDPAQMFQQIMQSLTGG